MDQAHLNLLSDEQKARYTALSRTFESPGWQEIEAWAKAQADDQLQRAAHSASWDQNRVAYGAFLVYSQVSALRARMEHEFEQLAAEAAVKLTVADEQEYE